MRQLRTRLALWIAPWLRPKPSVRIYPNTTMTTTTNPNIWFDHTS